MRLRIVLAGVALAAFALPTAAADRGVIEPLPFKPAIHDWTGPYVGIHGGYAWGEATASIIGLSASAEDETWLAGAQAGYLAQIDDVVVGLEADASYFDQDLVWVDTIRGRLGYAFESVLLYLTGGVAVTELDTDLPAINGDLHLGWVAGAGLEADILDGWSARAEYLYYDFSPEPYATAFGPVDLAHDAHTVRAALNY